MGKKYFLEVVIGATSKVGRGLKQAGSEIKAEFGRIGTAVTRLRDALDLGRYAVDAAKGLAGLAKEASDYGSTINDIGARTGLATASIQELGYAAGLAGTSTEEWGSALDTVTKNVGDLLAGRGRLKAFLSDVAGPGFVKALKAAKPDERLDLIIGAMLQIQDQAKRAAFAVAFFGEAGAKIAPLANEGADGIARMRKEARDLGLVMSGEDVKAMDEFGDETAKLEQGWQGVKRQIGAALATEFLPLVKEAVGWLKTHQPEVKAFAHDFAVGVHDAVVDIGKFLGNLKEIGPVALAIGGGLAVAFAPVTATLAALGGILVALDRFTKLDKTSQKEESLKAIERTAAIGGTAGDIAGLVMATPGFAGMGVDVGVERIRANTAAADAIARLQQSRALSATAPFAALNPALGAFSSALGGQQQAVKVTVEIKDPAGVTGQPRVDAPAGSKVTTKRLNTGSRTLTHL